MAQRKVAIITGAASGIGLALARHLLSRGYRVVIADINEERGKSIQEELGPSTHFICCDVSNWESSAAMFKSAYEWGGRIDFFAANAGISEREPFYTLPEELREPDLGTMEVDFNSVAYGLRLFRHYVREGATGEGGKMVVSSSMAGFYPMYLAPMYGAAKHAGIGLIRSAARKIYGDEGITLNAISPGPVDTGIVTGLLSVVPKEHLTPMSIILEAFDKFIDENITGQVAEATSLGIVLRKPVEFANESARFLNEDMHDESKFSNFYEGGESAEARNS